MNAPKAGNRYLYDVAFSYAGEDREYVERVAKAVEGCLKVFYDRHEQADLWGKNLYTHLSEVYGRQSRFCVMFISRHYARKVWTNHEREAAQARALSERGTYVLPARFDATTIPGILPTVGYMDLRELSPEQLGAFLLEKIGGSKVSALPSSRPWRGPWLTILGQFLLAVGGLSAIIAAGCLVDGDRAAMLGSIMLASAFGLLGWLIRSWAATAERRHQAATFIQVRERFTIEEIARLLGSSLEVAHAFIAHQTATHRLQLAYQQDTKGYARRGLPDSPPPLALPPA